MSEDSDVFAVLQAMLGGKLVSKELIFKDIRKEDCETFGERIVLNQIVCLPPESNPTNQGSKYWKKTIGII
ncbi:MAG: hypothetical protein CVU41_07560 [Chloroflexi bacterium HGW-Chloroflexi-3]|nr:MAG: hypothetical protein CVU41_07560 [Chloroflexi bacterium HGW-Chloroflexi-3]